MVVETETRDLIGRLVTLGVFARAQVDEQQGFRCLLGSDPATGKNMKGTGEEEGGGGRKS